MIFLHFLDQKTTDHNSHAGAGVRHNRTTPTTSYQTVVFSAFPSLRGSFLFLRKMSDFDHINFHAVETRKKLKLKMNT